MLLSARHTVAQASDPGAEPAAQDPERWARIDAFVERERRALRIPGLALGIVHDGRIVHRRGFGAADPSGRPVTPETRFLIGSATKSITAVAILQLQEEGRLELDAPVQRYLPWFTLADPAAAARLTVRHLLTHTSGLSPGAGLDVATNREDRQDGVLQRQVRAWSAAEVVTPPGAAFRYNNANYVILGLLVEALSGQSFESYVRRHVFAPLEMRGAGFGSGGDAAPPAATGYRHWFGRPRAARIDYGRAIGPAGGAIASVEDMAHYLIANLSGGRYGEARILSAEGVARMHRPQTPVPAYAYWLDGLAYGLGWFVGSHRGRPAVAHSGDLPTYHSDLLLLPEQRTGIVLLMNSNPRVRGERLRGIAVGVADLAMGREPAAVETGGGALAIVFRVVMGVAVLQLALIAGSVRKLRRWAREPARRPRGRWAAVRHVALPLAFHLLLALLLLVGLPLVMNLPLPLVLESTPDLGSVAIGSGLAAAVWGVVRSALAHRLLRSGLRTSSAAEAGVAAPTP